MRLQGLLASAFATLVWVLAGCAPQQHETKSVNIGEVRANLETVAAARVLLGHQSVGRNILAGVQTLSTEAGVPIRIVEVDGAPADDGPGLFHSNIGRNGDPGSKCEVFEHLLLRPERPQYDLAMMKFCYVDLQRDTAQEVEAMLARYDRVVERLAEQRPDVRLVHISLPLRTHGTGWRSKVKRIIGRDIPGDDDNVLRNAFNDGLRARYGDEPFFDLARLESTHADGSRSAFRSNGREIYTLAREYTSDGGHFNAAGQRVMAAEFLRTLARSLRDRAGAQLSSASGTSQTGSISTAE